MMRVFDIYDHILKKSYPSILMMRVFFNYVKIQFKDSINNTKMYDDYSAVIHRRSKCSLMPTTILALLNIFSIDNE